MIIFFKIPSKLITFVSTTPNIECTLNRDFVINVNKILKFIYIYSKKFISKTFQYKIYS